MQTALLHDLLQEVRLRGSAQVHKKKLLWLLGRKNEGDQGWEALLTEWVEVGGDRDTLYLHWVGEEYTLVSRKPQQISKAYNTGWQDN